MHSSAIDIGLQLSLDPVFDQSIPVSGLRVAGYSSLGNSYSYIYIYKVVPYLFSIFLQRPYGCG